MARLRRKHGSVLRVLMDAMEIGDRIFGASTPGENVDGAGEGQVKKTFDVILLLAETGY